MMDHARHLSSPSPTSPFLFHHSERSFKSNPLTPLLSSTADVTSVDDCFSTTTSSISHQNHNPFGVEHHHHHSLVDSHHGQQNHHHNHHHHHHHHHHHQRHQDQCVIDQDSLTGVDDDGMHNMLSGSSASSTSTMPLLTESHSHHSFSRISLEEYSPLSLVEDCDNALPISPTSLACGSHHSFKSSLNGLKMDNLVGDDAVGGHDHDGVHDDVNDARSMSPSLLSTANHHNLWSNSSTAITQNTSLLNSSSTSFLLSQHHQQQLNSLIQQLEPQSLDEAPPLVSNSSNFESNCSPHSIHRPSSEPPPGCGISAELPVDVDESKSLNCQPSQLKCTKQSGAGGVLAKGDQSGKTSNNKSAVLSPAIATSRSRKSRSRSAAKQQQNQASNNNKGKNTKVCDQDKRQQSNKTNGSVSLPTTTDKQQSVHCSKLHLQLNHHKKLQELQQRLFGTGAQSAITANTTAPLDTNKDLNNVNASHSTSSTTSTTSSSHHISTPTTSSAGVKEEPDSSASNIKSDATTSGQAATVIKPTTKSRPTRSRRGRATTSTTSAASSPATKTETCNPSSSTQSGATSNQQQQQQQQQKAVTTETAEPDTTTKSSDCFKLADLLSNTNDASKTNGNSFIANKFASASSETVDSDGSGDGGPSCVNTATAIHEKRVQQIQVQVSPSLTVVANGGLMQPISIQQQHQQQANGAIITTSGGTFTNQILCRPQTVVATAGGQLKGIVSNNELLKSGENVLSNWSLQTNTNNNQQNNTSNGTTTTATISANGQTIGAHQIAIQVICQDGTSLVLPVSSAAGLNAAVSLTSQHQQLQAVLANNVNNHQQRNTNQLLPLMSVSNIVAQQQVSNNGVTGGHENGTNNNNNGLSTIVSGGGYGGTAVSISSNLLTTNQNNHSNTTTTSTHTSGLAASSPTLAALLDAGSSRNTNDLSTGTNFASQNFVSTNLLRKLVSGGSTELKRAELSLQQGGPASSLITISAPNNDNNNNNNNGSSIANKTVVLNSNTICQGEKRIKLENAVEMSQLQTTYTLIDPQGLIVTSGNEKVNKQNALQTSNNASANHLQQQQHQQQVAGKAALADVQKSQIKLGYSSSTGNRQVDPTQPFRCEHCNSTFTRLGNFTRHKKIHTVPSKDGQRFKCDVCSKSFLQRCDLARHLHIHRGTEPHRCNICGKGYIRHSDLVTHQRFHNKEKPFGCPHCSKGFCQRGDLNRHLRSIHLQMKPILCPCCNRKFAKQETLLRHLNTAHRSKPGATTTSNAVIAELPPNYALTTQQSDDKQNTISVVNSAAVLNIAQKNAPVASLQAIQATLCKVPQSVDPSTTSGEKTLASPEQKLGATTDQLPSSIVDDGGEGQTESTIELAAGGSCVVVLPKSETSAIDLPE